MTDNIVQARGLRFGYGRFVAVDGVDLTLPEGELLALLGTNGAGKTTTVEMIEGHHRPDAGELHVLGRDPYRNRRRLAGDMSAMLQESGFAGDLTVTETLRLWQSLHRSRRRSGSRTSGEPVTGSPLAAVELEERAHVRVRQLSGGERRRLDLALALSTDPRLLVLDEPTTGMDPGARERTWEVLRGLLARGRSLLLTTHYLEEAEALADRVAIMHQGRIVVAGTVEEIVATQPSTIRCRLPDDRPPAPLPELAGQVHRGRPGHSGDHARQLQVRTPHLQPDLYRLLSWAAQHGITLDRLRATEATLADVFAAAQSDATSSELAPARAAPTDAPDSREATDSRATEEVVA